MSNYIELAGLTLPEINLSQQEDWSEIMLFSNQEQLSNPTSPTTGLTRTLSLPRIVKNEENNVVTEVINISTSNPSHLFWVPASQHPEISPAEFQKYVEVHGLNIREKGTRQRQSVLSVSFTPGDDIAEEHNKSDDIEMERKLTLDALERMGNINENTEKSLKEPENRVLLRRSVSLHFPKGNYHEIPDVLVFDRNSSPLDQSQALVPRGDRPLLRRGARNNFKRNLSVNSNQNPTVINRKSEPDYIQHQKEQQQQHTPLPLMRSASAESNTSRSAKERSSKPIVPIIIEEPSSPQEATESLDLYHRTIEPNIQTRKTWSWAFWSDEKTKKKNDFSPSYHVKPRPSKSSEPSFSGKRFTFSHLFSRKTRSSSLNTALSPTPPKDIQPKHVLMSRLPLYMERGIYKLSHMKLANPRRPLHEQVLISNHMFWYLSIISTNTDAIHPGPILKPKKPIKKPRSSKKKPLPQNKQDHSNGDALSPFMNSHSIKSTGFVVPENYLNPDNRNYNFTGEELDSSPESLQDDIPLAMYKSYRKKSRH